MAKRKGKKKSYRRKSGISLLTVAETYMLANVATQAFFNTNPVQFLIGDTMQGSGAGMAKGRDQLSVREFFRPGGMQSSTWSTGKVIQNNIRRNWPLAVTGMVLIPIGFRLGKAVARPAISRANRLLNQAGIGRTVKV